MMGNPAFWGRLGLVWCLLVFGACSCANDAVGQTTAATTPADAAQARSKAARADASRASTRLTVSNSAAPEPSRTKSGETVVHAMPTLDGSGLFVLATLLGVCALWMWRRRQ